MCLSANPRLGKLGVGVPFEESCDSVDSAYCFIASKTCLGFTD